MTHAPPAAHPPRPSAEYRWTPRKARAFLEALAEHGKVAAAARSVGMTRQSAYRLRDRMPQVAEVWSRAQALGRARRGKVTVANGKLTLSPVQGDSSAGAR
jgi:molybdenum-dependent DNA-binding transcriptional regulator ModE